jgi:hypothetical protein
MSSVLAGPAPLEACLHPLPALLPSAPGDVSSPASGFDRGKPEEARPQFWLGARRWPIVPVNSSLGRDHGSMTASSPSLSCRSC